MESNNVVWVESGSVLKHTQTHLSTVVHWIVVLQNKAKDCRHVCLVLLGVNLGLIIYFWSNQFSINTRSSLLVIMLDHTGVELDFHWSWIWRKKVEANNWRVEADWIFTKKKRIYWNQQQDWQKESAIKNPLGFFLCPFYVLCFYTGWLINERCKHNLDNHYQLFSPRQNLVQSPKSPLAGLS